MRFLNQTHVLFSHPPSLSTSLYSSKASLENTIIKAHKSNSPVNHPLHSGKKPIPDEQINIMLPIVNRDKMIYSKHNLNNESISQ